MKILILCTAILTLAGCDDFGTELPPAIAVADLEQAPDTIEVDGKQVYLSTEMWRNFMPIAPPDGYPLYAILYLTTADSSQFPASVSADAFWMVYQNEVWRSYFTAEPVYSHLQRPYRLVKIAKDGPKWGPGVYVDVVVRVFDAHQTAHLLRAGRQYIGRLD